MGRSLWRNLRLCVAVALVLALTVSSAYSLTITRSYISSGSSFPAGYGTATGAPSTTYGTGNLVSIFNAAADWWELAIQDSHTVAISYGWQGLGAGILGVHAITAVDGSGRETTGVIRFASNYNNFFLDSTPKQNEEFGSLSASSANYGGGSMNTGRLYSALASGAANGHIDLFSVALHEIGHAMGLSSGNPRFLTEVAAESPRTIDLTSPLSYAGAAIPVVDASAHLNDSSTLMWTTSSTSRRLYGSEADILSMAQISAFSSLDLDPSFVPIPEPATFALLGLGLLGITAASRRKRRKAA